MKRFIISAAVGLLAGGCSGTVPRSGNSGGLPGAAPRVEEPAAETSERSGLTLAEALSLAASGHPEIAEAVAFAEAAEGRAEQAALLPNPEASARMETAPFGSGTTTDADYLLGVSQAVPLGGRLSDARRAYQLEAARLAMEARVRERALTKRVRGAFAEALFFERMAALRARVAEASTAALQAVLSREAAGDATADEIARARLDSARSSAETRSAVARANTSRAALAAAMGQPRLRISSLAGDLEEAMEVPALEDLNARIAGHPVLAAADADIAALEAFTELARSERVPDLNIDVGYRYIGDGDTHAFDLGVSLALPAWNRNQGRLREAEADIAAARARARRARSGLEGDLRQAVARLSATLDALRTARETILPAVAEVLRVAEARFAAGDASALELALARRDGVAAEFEILDLLREANEAWGDLQDVIP